MPRDHSIDVTRGTYIIMMVLYHCVSVANKVQPSELININNYLVLVSGSFPFLAGYLVGNHYLRQVESMGISVARRLFNRGAHLLLIYTVINVIILYSPELMDKFRFASQSSNPIYSILTVEPSQVVYDILVPLGLILIVGASIAAAFVFVRNRLHGDILYALVAIAGIGLTFYGHHPYMACGLLGIYFGHYVVDTRIISFFNNHRFFTILAVVYGVILAMIGGAMRYSGISYVLGVILLFYAIRAMSKSSVLIILTNTNGFKRFSKYSLLIYLAHVPFLIITGHYLAQIYPYIAFEPLILILTISVFIVMYLLSFSVDAMSKKSERFRTIYRTLLG